LIRIYPVYITGFVVLVFGLYIVDFNGDGIPYTKEHLLIHSLIVVRQWFGYQRIDGISWTLEIELYFYITMFILFQFQNNRRHVLISIILMSIALVIVSRIRLFLQFDWYESRQLLMIGYMLLGYFFYKAKKNHISLFQVVFFYVVILSAMYLFYQNTKPFSFDFWRWYIPYFISPILFFWIIFYWREYRIDYVSKFFSQISYPLYVVHPIFGYSLLVYLLKAGYSSWLALIIVWVVVILMAYFIHQLIEKPALRYAKKFNYKKPKVMQR
jgi:peptidoglycan/LPS O-acetylase OafA/YrhL